jgi:CheY-like chemotaxis protein
MNSPEKIIVVADDDLDDQELLQEVLLGIEKDAQVLTFSAGKEVLEYLRCCDHSKRPCLIILDYNMPDMNGAQVTEIIYQDESYRHTPVLVWSTSNSAVYRLECEQKGARQYFYKPHDFEQIIQMARQMLSYCEDIVSK